MFSSLQGFFQRHRRKILYTGIVLGGGFVLGKIAQWKLNNWYETQQVELLAQSKKQLHFDGNQKTCAITLYSLLPNLRDAIFELADSQSITEKLKTKPVDKLVLWEELKILSFTRTIASVYASSLLALFLRVQLNLLGGYMFVDVEATSTVLNGVGGTSVGAEVARMSDPIQKKYLGIVRYFLDTGVKELVDVIKQVVEEVLGNVSLKQKLSYHDVQRMLGQIRQCLKLTSHQPVENGNNTIVKISSIVIDQENTLMDKDSFFQQLVNETSDILDSEDFGIVYNACLDVGFSFIMKRLLSSFIIDQQDTPTDMIWSMEDDICSMHLPLAKICPIINGRAEEILAEEKNNCLQDMDALECVKDFAANIYEAFSCRPKAG
ncbi:peroxisomal biogenesis factor 3-like [Xenia sp. Carnegie-2017]|uniref:peroxisomal biogenesis factor 3-like n=1 Tax=Xenia sp. Carnegie-2017 TaxID=2897299 RepID=UPI001F03BFFC|nr:peroxisomal biogenesis factor 3-like [Xenia sp. Carnegie-2017]